MVPAACRSLTTGAAQKPLQHCVETAMVDPVDKKDTFGAATGPPPQSVSCRSMQNLTSGRPQSSVVPAACRLLTTGAAQKPLQHCVEAAMVDPVEKDTYVILAWY